MKNYLKRILSGDLTAGEIENIIVMLVGLAFMMCGLQMVLS